MCTVIFKKKQKEKKKQIKATESMANRIRIILKNGLKKLK